MRTLFRRVGKLEQNYGVDTSKPPLRFVVDFPWKGPVNWQESQCSRTRYPGGNVTEIVQLEGEGGKVSREQLDQFISTFPIQPRGAA